MEQKRGLRNYLHASVMTYLFVNLIILVGSPMGRRCTARKAAGWTWNDLLVAVRYPAIGHTTQITSADYSKFSDELGAVSMINSPLDLFSFQLVISFTATWTNSCGFLLLPENHAHTDMLSRPNERSPRFCEVKTMFPSCIFKGKLASLYLTETYIPKADL